MSEVTAYAVATAAIFYGLAMTCGLIVYLMDRGVSAHARQHAAVQASRAARLERCSS
jgi:hypothetical protein